MTTTHAWFKLSAGKDLSLMQSRILYVCVWSHLSLRRHMIYKSINHAFYNKNDYGSSTMNIIPYLNKHQIDNEHYMLSMEKNKKYQSSAIFK